MIRVYPSKKLQRGNKRGTRGHSSAVSNGLSCSENSVQTRTNSWFLNQRENLPEQILSF